MTFDEIGMNDRQKAIRAGYDQRCDAVFRDTRHARAFREVVTSSNGSAFIPVARQLPLAELIRAELDEAEKRGRDLGGTTIRQRAMTALRIAMRFDIPHKSKADLRRINAMRAVLGLEPVVQHDIDPRELELARDRVARLWKKATTDSTRLISALEDLAEEAKIARARRKVMVIDREALRHAEHAIALSGRLGDALTRGAA